MGLKRENHSPLMAACLKAFFSIQRNQQQQKPNIVAEILRQPLFRNPLILKSKDKPLGLGPNIGLYLWARVGITQVRHFWEEDRQDWMPIKEIAKLLLAKGVATENSKIKRLQTISHIL